MQKNRGITPVIVFLIVTAFAVLGAVGYSAFKNNVAEDKLVDEFASNVDISDWKTYKNEKYGFEIKYPLNWKVEENRLTNENSLYSFSLVEPSTEDFLNKYPGTDTLTYDVSIVLYKLNYRDNFSNRISTPIVFDGIKGDKIVYVDVGMGTSTSMYLDGKNYSYQLDIGGRNKKESDKILSTFKFIDKNPTSENCFVGGCSSQLCTDIEDGGISTCEWNSEYACYKKAKCERQSSGQCGWTETSELKSCLANPPK